MLSHSVVSDSTTLWTVALQAPLSMGFPREEYWSRLPFPSPKDLSNPEIKLVSPVSPALQVDSLPWAIRAKSITKYLLSAYKVKNILVDTRSAKMDNKTGPVLMHFIISLCKLWHVIGQDKMVGWHHWLNGHEFEQTLGNGEEQGSLACYSPNMTEAT